MWDKLTFILFHYLLPYAIALGCLIWIINFIEDRYQKANEDQAIHKFLTYVFYGAIGVTIIILLHWFFTEISIGIWIANLGKKIWHIMTNLPFLGTVSQSVGNGFSWVTEFCHAYVPYYLHAFVLTFFFGTIVALAGLKWRISFSRALNVIVPVIVEFPVRMLMYFSGYETPVKDLILQGKIRAKIRENLNDSYEAAIRGYDDRGKKFEDGAGGTASTQNKKAATVAMRRTKVTVKTAAGNRKAHILIKQSRETETDRTIENILKGLGERISENSIYFPADPTYNTKEKGYTFDSLVAYEPGKELGSFKAIFDNPFEEQTKVSLGGKGSFYVFFNDVRNFIKYIFHLSPSGLKERIIDVANQKFYRDTSADKAKYKVQQNLDLSVIPVPKDHDTGNTIDAQRKLALQKANARVEDVSTALGGFGLSGQYKKVSVGGNTAIYEFALPPDPKLPNDFDKVQEQIGNLLHINDKPIITLQAGTLKISMNNGVNIPVSFSDMIKNRKKGASCIISGMAGVDAMNKPIYFELGDKNPHAILFGETGTGKTVTIFTIIYSVMSATDPKHLRIAYIDGKGNSFEFMKLDGDHPNPFLYAPPADASGDINYARALIKHLEMECRRRIDLFKHEAVAKLSEYNEKHPDKPLYEILAVVDEFSAITQQDKDLKASEMVKKGTIDKFEYLAKMARSVGIRLLLANQSARKELVPGKIAANITGRVSLGVSEPIEAEIALPETGIKVNLVSQPGEFYSIMNGPTNPEHGNSPYIPQDIANKLNDKLTEKFGKATYVKTREQILEETEFAEKKDDSKSNVSESSMMSHVQNSEKSIHRFGSPTQTNDSSKTTRQRAQATKNDDSIIEPPEKVTVSTPLSRIANLACENQYIPYLRKNMSIISRNKALKSTDEKQQKEAMALLAGIQKRIDRYDEVQKQANSEKNHPHSGSNPEAAKDIINKITRGQHQKE